MVPPNLLVLTSKKGLNPLQEQSSSARDLLNWARAKCARDSFQDTQLLFQTPAAFGEGELLPKEAVKNYPAQLDHQYLSGRVTSFRVKCGKGDSLAREFKKEVAVKG